jgi:large subunit GTPase 1
MRSGQGNPDEARAARFILKDYVNGKLLYCHAPPTTSEDGFQEETHARQLLRVAGKKRAPTTRVGKDADTYVAPTPANADGTQSAFGNKALAVEDDFFQRQGLSARPFVAGSNKNGMTLSRPTFYPNQVLVAEDGTPLAGQQARLETMMRNADLGGGKKNHKKMKRVKQRSGKGYD